MKPGCAIALLVAIIIAAAVVFGFGAWKHGSGSSKEDSSGSNLKDDPPDFTKAIGKVTGALAPPIGLKDLSMGGIPLKDRRIELAKGASVALKVAAADSDTRRLRLVLVDPKLASDTPLPLGGALVAIEYRPVEPLPEAMEDIDLPEDDETKLPNPDPSEGGDRAEYVLPIFARGAEVTLINKAERKVVVEVK